MFYLKVIVLFLNWYPPGVVLESLPLVYTLENEDGVFLDGIIVGVSSLNTGEDCKSFPRGATKTGGDKVGGPLLSTVERTGLYCCMTDMLSITGGMDLSGVSGVS